MSTDKINRRKPLIAALDDDAVVRKYIGLALKDEGEIVFAETISDFREILEEKRPDIFLIDVNLPDGDGIELCRELRQNEIYTDSFFIILTSLADNDRIEKAYAAGADEFMRKPFVHFELLSKIRILVNVMNVRDNLKQSFQTQLDQNVQLFRLSDFIKRSLSFRDNEAVLRNAEVLSEIIDVDYIEIVKVRNGVPLSITQRDSYGRNRFISFREILKSGQVLDNMTREIRYFSYKKGGLTFYNSMFAIICQNTVFGYVLLQRSEAFTHGEREVISLFLDYMNLLNDSLTMQGELRGRNDQYRKEIDLIRKLEVSRLPDLKTIKGYTTGYSFMPAQDLSGDFFDGYLIDDDIYQVVLCDVSGHGIASSYVGTQIRTIIREKSTPGKRPSEIVREVNRELYAGLKDMRFYCTAQIVQIYYDTDTLLFLSAGHPEAVVYSSASGSISSLVSPGPVIGMFSDEVYREQILRLDSGDFLFMYTDGLVEEHDANMEKMYGLERLKNSLLAAAAYDSTEIIHHMLGDFYEFNGYRPQTDDITVICIRKN